MKDPFLEIGFQAETSRYEDEEFEEYAKKNCNECFATRHKDVQELRRMIIDKGKCSPRRMDDAYLIKFLRCRRYIPALAHKLMVRYEDFRHKNPELYDCDGFGLTKVKHVYGGVSPESPKYGRIVLMRFGRWETDAVPIIDLVRCALFMNEIVSLQPKMQILGVTVLVDLQGLSLSHISQLTPTVANQIVSLMGVAYPLIMHSCHIVNYSWILHSIFYLFKQFMPTAVLKQIYFHGSDMASLQRHIDPEFLPEEYGGRCRHYISSDVWISKMDMYKDDFIVKELRELGFTIKERSHNQHKTLKHFYVCQRKNNVND